MLFASLYLLFVPFCFSPLDNHFSLLRSVVFLFFCVFFSFSPLTRLFVVFLLCFLQFVLFGVALFSSSPSLLYALAVVVFLFSVPPLVPSLVYLFLFSHFIFRVLVLPSLFYLRHVSVGGVGLVRSLSFIPLWFPCSFLLVMVFCFSLLIQFRGLVDKCGCVGAVMPYAVLVVNGIGSPVPTLFIGSMF